MSTRTSSLPVLAAALLALAGAATAQTSRSDIKAETRAAEKAGRLTPAGEGSPTDATPSTASTRTRAERKAETLQARKDGLLRKPGPAPEYVEARAMAKRPSTTTRAERKAATSAAAKAHQLTPAGEAVLSSGR